ncbi:P-loop containing nucleoside triphosphate hydrolase protein [Annulohypoxylon truncatum]|uniref:P-loop containing nucleoside triphosphate hydrolase protein n=1 Tax=Annulohypoxylon truncatum TaxID=327061 RepID=UPI0020088391|nr:P-loop containing nucleoside triphosphate hydrolase protein [Annulohypoxylon truncatum]KAI1208672.1 P-loop containing nucleoside triphosphate hydrolase protein [Annulohypoxylon truncatum]
MVLAFNAETLNGLCSKDQLELLDAIDHLRLQGIDHYISLPQIIVCGDQSSGKSSVLEAISGVPFPVKSNLCTCFPTELVLRRSSETGVTVSIIPDNTSKTSAQDDLHKFHQELEGFEGFPDLVEKAKAAMGISTSGKAFSKDRLRVEITGPDRPHLTIIDMPGLIHSETKSQSLADVKLVRKVVKGYMKQPRSIILAVVSAKNDFANQVVLNFAREVDKRGSRTMGVITKPDTLVQGSPSEALYVSLAKNNQVNFDLGWHVLKNLDSETQNGSSLLGHRNAEEALFFSKGVWNELPSSMLGINELRKKLSSVLLRQIAFELPSLIREINLKLDDSREDLEKLGEPRRTLDEQRLRLLQISEEFQSLVERSVSGTYNGAFFEDAETDQGYQERIRAVIQALNKGFANDLVKRGHRREIGEGKQASPNDPELVTRDKFLDHVENMMQRTRGRELPGIFSSMVVADLFQQQSSPWERIAQGHVKKAWEAVGEFLELVVLYVADASIIDALVDKIIQPALSKLLMNAKSKANKLLDSHRRVHPITYNHEYAKTIHCHCCHSKDEISKIIESFFGLSSIGTRQALNSYYNLTTLVDNLAKQSVSNIERSAACEALDRMLSYYQIALKRFIDSIATEVIEQKILMPLSDILSPVAVFKMPPDLVELIAGESQESRTKREDLTKKIDVLQRGLKTCERFVDSKLKGRTSILSSPI